MHDDKLPRSRFLEPETREGYFIDGKMKSVWKAQLDIVEEFLRICKKYNLKCFGIGGTLLGAVRHKGYIPWDDDVDFAMPRKDYDIFCRVAVKELKPPYFLQNMETDALFDEGISKIRNSSTTQITKWSRDHHVACNQGICIDLFSLDCVSDDKSMKRRYLADRCLRKIRGMTRAKLPRNPVRFLAGAVCRIVRIVLGNRVLSRMREWMFRIYDRMDVKTVGLLTYRFDYKKCWWSRECFDDIINVPYEYIDIPIPAEYDKILAIQYGDWRKPVKGASLHSEIFFDVEKPYTYYLEKWGYIKRG